MNNKADFRFLENGNIIPTEYYSDQPFLIKADDGSWVLTVTTGSGFEGVAGQHIISMRSTDYGKTWGDVCDIEPADAPESSYSVLLKNENGRIFCFYNYNIENLRKIKAHVTTSFPTGTWTRVDSQGHFFFKYSDDNGKSWSNERHEIPIRETEIDRTNLFAGKVKMFWNVGKAFEHKMHAYVPLHKIGAIGEGGFRMSEGVLLHSENLLHQQDLTKIKWETLPDGEIGLRTPVGGGLVAEEQSFCTLSDGTIYCVYRSVDGYPVVTYSYDLGRTFSEPRYQQYVDKRPMKHPRAANFTWKCKNGKYLYWFHNHGGKDYSGRNPVWVSGGVEIDTPTGKEIAWTQPEILLYDGDINIIISYPDFIEDDGKYFITETQKVVARTHEIPKEFLEKLWGQFENKDIETKGLTDNFENVTESEIKISKIEKFSCYNRSSDIAFRGFTIEISCKFKNFDTNKNLFSTMDTQGKGILVRLADSTTIEFQISDSITNNRYRTSPGLLEPNKTQYISIIVDADARIMSFVVNESFCDGGKYKQFGFGRFSEDLDDVNGNEIAVLGCDTVDVDNVRIYNRALMISECIGNHRYTKK